MSGCERAVFSGGYITGWGPCASAYTPPSHRREEQASSCPVDQSDPFDWKAALWDAFGPDWTWLIPEAKGVKLLSSAVVLAKRFSKEKQALVDMAKLDKRFGATRADVNAYGELNRGLPDPFPGSRIRVDEGHLSGAPHSRVPHGHVGPIDHIPITDP
jgi:hypothetical protein